MTTSKITIQAEATSSIFGALYLFVEQGHEIELKVGDGNGWITYPVKSHIRVDPDQQITIKADREDANIQIISL